MPGSTRWCDNETAGGKRDDGGGVVGHHQRGVARAGEEHNLKPKSFAELGYEGHWLIDDASPQDRQAVVGLVPAIPRCILLHGFAESYRRKAAACWAPTRPTRRVQKSGRCELRADARRRRGVWMSSATSSGFGEWSHECVGVGWLGGATSATPGARFRGRNRSGIFRWGRVCEIVVADPYELVWRTVSDQGGCRALVTPTVGPS